jgi:hypothetical protein
MVGDLKDAVQSVRAERAEEMLRAPLVRGAWKVIGGIAAAVLLVFGGIQVVVQLAHEEYTVVEEVPAADVAMLDVRNDAGSVIVRGSDRNSETITVTARVSHGLRRTGHRQSLQGERLVLESTCPAIFTSFCDVRYTVDVPTDIDVVVRGASGSIVVSDVNGDVDLDTDSGGIDVARVEGGLLRMDSDAGSVTATAVGSPDVEATSDEGGVYVAFTEAPDAVWADSDAGGVEIVLPRGEEEYGVEADSNAGGVDITVDQDPSSPRTITATSDAGGVTVRYGAG